MIDRPPRWGGQTARGERPWAFAVVSLALHLAAVAVLSLATVRGLAPPPTETAVALVFATTVEAMASPDPVAAPEPDPQPPEPSDPRLNATAPPEPIPPPPPPSVPRPPAPRPVRPAQARPVAPPAPRDAPAGPTTAAPPPSEGPSVDPAWQSRLAAWLSAHKTYPDDARRRGEQGRVSIQFTVDRSGRVLAVEIVGGSGSDRLDNATLAMLRGATLPPFPDTMRQDTLTVTTTLHYALR